MSESDITDQIFLDIECFDQARYSILRKRGLDCDSLIVFDTDPPRGKLSEVISSVFDVEGTLRQTSIYSASTGWELSSLSSHLSSMQNSKNVRSWLRSDYFDEFQNAGSCGTVPPDRVVIVVVEWNKLPSSSWPSSLNSARTTIPFIVPLALR